MTTKQQIEKLTERVAYLEHSLVTVQTEIAVLKGKELRLIGQPAATQNTVTLEELKSTVKVLEQYKSQGITKIEL